MSLHTRKKLGHMVVDPAVHGKVCDESAVAAMGGQGEGKTGRLSDPIEIGVRDHGVVFAQNDPRGDA